MTVTPAQRTIVTRRLLLIIALSSLLPCVRARPGHAAVQEIEATGRYHLGDNDTKLDGRRLALLEAKRNALEKAGTYVESITEVKDFQLTRDDIRTYTAGIIETEEVGEPKWEMLGSTLRCTVTVKARVDKDNMMNRIASLRKDKEATQELREARKKTEENERKVADLNKQLKKAKKGSPAAKRAKESRDNALAGIDAATLKAQAIAVKNFSQAEWVQVRNYVNRNVDLKGCMPFKSTQPNQGTTADAGHGLLLVAGPALAFAVSKPRRGKHSKQRRKDAESEKSS
jgi:hypothetical protein